MSELLNAVWYGGGRSWILLWPFSLVYRAAYRAHRWAGLRSRRRARGDDVPVIVIGNITAGGTGKTPFTIWLTRQLALRGFNVGIVSRGYLGNPGDRCRMVSASGDPSEFGDEAVLLADKTNCPVVVGADRVAAKAKLLVDRRVDVVLADDGLQHHRLARACEIVVVDGSRGVGNGKILPAGPLRESTARLATVDAVVVNGGDWTYPGAFRCDVRVETVQRLGSDERKSLEEFSGMRVHAFAGIGNPERFFELLESFQIEVLRHPLADHARITAPQLQIAGGLPVFMTEKDAVKCRDLRNDNVWVVEIDLDFPPADAARLLSLVRRCVFGDECID